jgi:hypothetical protein
MPSYFKCAGCGRVSVLSTLQNRCPHCGSLSGEYSSEPPAEAPRRETGDGDDAAARAANRRGR